MSADRFFRRFRQCPERIEHRTVLTAAGSENALRHSAGVTEDASRQELPNAVAAESEQADQPGGEPRQWK